MTPPLVPSLAFLTVVSGLLCVWSLLGDLWLRDRERLDRRLRDEFGPRDAERSRRPSLFKDLAALADTGEPRGWRAPLHQLRLLLEQSGLEWTPRRFLHVTLGSALLGTAAGLLVHRVIGGLVGLPLGMAAPLVFVAAWATRRRERLQAQVPDVFEQLARGLRAGQSLPQALQSVGDEFPSPVGPELVLCREQHNLGLPLEAALRDLGRRTGLLELRVFAVALAVQEQAGGNLAELLDKLAATSRERLRTRRRVKALSAEGRMQAAVLLALPPALFVVMLFLKRSYAEVLLAHPGLLVGMLALQLVGLLWIRRIVNFEF
jgi:tight adherence protein B